MDFRISRRDLAAVLISTPAAAQTSRTKPEGDLQAETGAVQATSQKLSAIELPMDVEPAFQFKA